MKKLFILMLMFLAQLGTRAQKAVISDFEFEEPDQLCLETFQTDNGNTFLLNITRKGGMEAILFDKNHQKVNQTIYKGKIWEADKINDCIIEAMFEIQNKLVVFIKEEDNMVISLYRVLISTENGMIEKEECIAASAPYGEKDRKRAYYGQMPYKRFCVAKDDRSDSYAIAAVDPFLPEIGHQIRLTSYNGSHEQVGQAYYDLPDAPYQYLSLLGFAVSDGNVFAAACGIRDPKDKDNNGTDIIISKLAAHADKVQHSIVSTKETLKEAKAVLRYNPANNNIGLMLLSYMESKSAVFSSKRTNYYSLLLNAFDGTSLKLLYSKPVSGAKITSYAATHLDEHTPFSGMPCDFIMNADNTATILMEAVETNGSHSYSVHLGNIGLLDVDSDGKETSGFMIRKKHVLNFRRSAFSLSWEHMKSFAPGGSGGFTDPGYYSFDFISNSNGRYFIYNDNPKNFDRSEKKDPGTVVNVTASNTSCYKLVNGKMEKTYLLGEPTGDVDYRFTLISSGHYNAKSNIYTAVVMEVAGRRKRAHLAWVSL